MTQKDSNPHLSIQPWSRGDIFPAIIARKEVYPPGKTAENSEPSTSFPLLLDGYEEEYATYNDAREVALALIRDPVLRDAWRFGQD
jgi:hypothetical protein